jgi:hypothetical protein
MFHKIVFSTFVNEELGVECLEGYIKDMRHTKVEINTTITFIFTSQILSYLIC